MQQITLPTEPNTRLSVVTRSMHRRPEHPSQDARPKPPVAQPVEVPNGLEFVAQFLVSNTRASGVAIAILDETGLHCRASAGEAPQPGTAIRMENTISGQCIQSGAFFHCEDTLTKCPNALPARSILLLPILWGRNARGLVALFSRQPEAFDSAGIAIARSATALAAITLNALSPQLDCPIDGLVLEADLIERPALAAAPAETHTPQLPAQTDQEDVLEENVQLRPGKVYYGLPCAKCGAYSSTTEKRCPVCRTPK
jgi:hypothetical protein